MTDLALVLKSNRVVSAVYPGGKASILDNLIARYSQTVATAPDGTTKQSCQAELDHYALHDAIEVPDGSVFVGDTHVSGTTFTAGPLRIEHEGELAGRTTLSGSLAQLAQIADGSQAITNLSQAVTALRLVAGGVVFLARAWLRRNL